MDRRREKEGGKVQCFMKKEDKRRIKARRVCSRRPSRGLSGSRIRRPSRGVSGSFDGRRVSGSFDDRRVV